MPRGADQQSEERRRKEAAKGNPPQLCYYSVNRALDLLGPCWDSGKYQGGHISPMSSGSPEQATL